MITDTAGAPAMHESAVPAEVFEREAKNAHVRMTGVRFGRWPQVRDFEKPL